MRAVLIACGLAGCGAPTLGDVEAEVFRPSCSFSACHSGKNARAGLDLSAATFARLVNVPSSEDPPRVRIAPGSSEDSYLVDKLLGRNLPAAPRGESWGPMPPTDRLEPHRLELVRAWVDAGARGE